MQIDRLLKIVLILLKKEQVTAKVLSEKFSVSQRTIYRDIDTLSLAGIPVYATKGYGGGISLLKSYKIDKFFLTEKEQKEILFALQSLSASYYPDIDDTINKISEVFNHVATSNWIEVDFSYWGSHDLETVKFNTLKEAILNKRIIEFDYYNSHGTKSHRLVESLKLIYKGHAWYLLGYSRDKEDYRTYRISRIRNLVLQEDYFNRIIPNNLNIDKKDVAPLQTVVLVLKFSNDVAFRIYDDFNNGTIQYNDDDTITVTIEYPYDEWVFGYLLSFGNKVEVISPDYIRESLIQRAEAIINKYK